MKGTKGIQHKPVRWHGKSNGTKVFWDAVTPFLRLVIRHSRPPVWQVNIYPRGATLHRVGKPNPRVMSFDPIVPKHPGLVPGKVIVQAFPVVPPCPN